MDAEILSCRDATRIDSLILIAGASCSGKTTLLRRLRASGPEVLPPELRPEPRGDYVVLNAMDLDDRSLGKAETIFLHYDIFRPVTFFDGLDFAADRALDVLARAGRLRILTLWEDPAILRDRALARRRRLWRKLVKQSIVSRPLATYAAYRGARARRRRMQPFFDDPAELWRLYAAWLGFCNGRTAEHWIARPSDGLALHPVGRALAGAPLWPVVPYPPAMDREDLSGATR